MLLAKTLALAATLGAAALTTPTAAAHPHIQNTAAARVAVVSGARVVAHVPERVRWPRLQQVVKGSSATVRPVRSRSCEHPQESIERQAASPAETP